MRALVRVLTWKSVVSLFALVLAGLASGSALADSGHRDYEFLLGSGFLCSLGADACPDIAVAANGDTVEVAGEGTFSIHSKSAAGGGSFTHKGAGGAVLTSGTWRAVQLLSFHSYGSGTAQGLPANFEGGKALLHVQLLPAGGGSFDAILRITCLLGDKVPAGADEGIRLNVQGITNFSDEVSGATVFLRQ
jgi:hypothetical protein